jgi:hypothetical protein
MGLKNKCAILFECLHFTLPDKGIIMSNERTLRDAMCHAFFCAKVQLGIHSFQMWIFQLHV